MKCKNKRKLQKFIDNYKTIVTYLDLVKKGIVQPKELLEGCEPELKMDLKVTLIMAGYIEKEKGDTI